MKFEEFKAIVKHEIASKMGNNYEVNLNEVSKNNGLVLTGISIRGENESITPTIYIDDFYEEYQKSNRNISEIVNEIVDVAARNRIKEKFDFGFFTDFDNIKNRIIFKLINTEMNQELLKDVPHVKFHDLSIIFQVLLEDKCNIQGMSTITIHHQHCKIWEAGLDDLVFAARKNTPRLLESELIPMMDVIRELMGKTVDPDLFRATENDVNMFVLSNKRRINGASTLLYKGILQDFADSIDRNLFILPSSIHECILLPDTGIERAKELKAMVKEINDTQVSPEEVLSYSIYYYDREKNELSVL